MPCDAAGALWEGMSFLSPLKFPGTEWKRSRQDLLRCKKAGREMSAAFPQYNANVGDVAMA